MIVMLVRYAIEMSWKKRYGNMLKLNIFSNNRGIIEADLRNKWHTYNNLNMVLSNFVLQ